MSDSTNFGGTVSGGIQDISALLPLLGTEQCEQHVGSALDKGFLYSAVTPMSIFGSLGVVRASFSILIASFTIQRFQFLGAQALRNSGFRLSGSVAPMIGIAGKRFKFLAETNLEFMLAEEHIDNVVDLTVSLGKDVLQWNIKLVYFTLFISSAGLFPYISIIRSSGDANPKFFFPLGFGFPILRVFGSAVCVIITQFLIQIRIAMLLKARLLFIRMNQLVKEDGIESLASLISSSSPADGSSNGRAEAGWSWSSELPAERCIWALEKWLAMGFDEEKRPENHQKINNLYVRERKLHFGSRNSRIRPWIIVVLCSILAVGCVSTVVGYVGCFFLIQHSASSTGTLIWLGVEAALSVLRTLVWAANPSWDDPEGVVFKLELSTNPPIITCKETVHDILRVGIETPLARSSIFIKDVVAYAGPLQSVPVQDVQLFYILAAREITPDESKRTPPYRSGALKRSFVYGNNGEAHNEGDRYEKCLIIVISADNEPQQGRMLVKEVNAKAFDIYICSLRPVFGTAVINVKAEKKTEPTSHFLTADVEFMAQLHDNYAEIYAKIRRKHSEAVSVCRTWSMQQRPQTEPAASDQSAFEDDGPLTVGELKYLRLKNAVNNHHSAWTYTEHGVITCLTQYEDSLGISPPDANQTAGDVSNLELYDTIEKEFLRLECQRYFESALLYSSAIWDMYLKTENDEVVKTLLEPQLARAVRPTDRIRQTRLKTRLVTEMELYLEEQTASRRTNILARISKWQHPAPPPTSFFGPASRKHRQLESLREAVKIFMDLVNGSDRPLQKAPRHFRFDIKEESVKFKAAIQARLEESGLDDNAAINGHTNMHDVFLGRADELSRKFAAIDPGVYDPLNFMDHDPSESWQVQITRMSFKWDDEVKAGPPFALKVTGSKVQRGIPLTTQKKISDYFP